MPVNVTLAQIQHLAPNARSSYREAFQNGQAVLDQCGISDSPLRVAHFMAQVLHESSGLSFQIESLNYSPERLPKVWPSRFKPVGPLELRKQNAVAPDFVTTPDAAFSAQWCLAVAAAKWASVGCNAFADQDDIRRVTRAINGGLIGLSDRTDWLRLTKAVWP